MKWKKKKKKKNGTKPRGINYWILKHKDTHFFLKDFITDILDEKTSFNFSYDFCLYLLRLKHIVEIFVLYFISSFIVLSRNRNKSIFSIMFTPSIKFQKCQCAIIQLQFSKIDTVKHFLTFYGKEKEIYQLHFSIFIKSSELQR